MIRCHLSRLMGERKVKASDVARETGLAWATVNGLYYETTQRFDGHVLEALCRYFNCQVGDILMHVPDE